MLLRAAACCCPPARPHPLGSHICADDRAPAANLHTLFARPFIRTNTHARACALRHRLSLSLSLFLSFSLSLFLSLARARSLSLSHTHTRTHIHTHTHSLPRTHTATSGPTRTWASTTTTGMAPWLSCASRAPRHRRGAPPTLPLPCVTPEGGHVSDCAAHTWTPPRPRLCEARRCQSTKRAPMLKYPEPTKLSRRSIASVRRC